MRMHFMATVVLALSLAGCGGSSAPAGGSGDGSGNHDPGRSTGQVLGTRGVPGGTITVSCDGPLQPGTSALFHLALSAGMPAPSSVQAWIGVAYDPAAVGVAATPVAATPGTWDAAVTIPSPVTAGSHVWVRLTFADGSVVETGGEDFMLAAL
jgi:hypothetical protein